MTITSNQVVQADHVPGPAQGGWTYAHYAALPNDGKRYEIIDGVLYMVPPSPSEEHQRSSLRFSYYLFTYVELAGLGRVYAGPFDVELRPDMVVQPDLLAVLNANIHKIVSTRVIGGPDLVVEIASPSTVVHDRHRKRLAYAKAGVKEYWLVDPDRKSIEVLVLEETAFHSIGVFQGKDLVRSQIVPVFPVRAEQLFA